MFIGKKKKKKKEKYSYNCWNSLLHGLDNVMWQKKSLGYLNNDRNKCIKKKKQKKPSNLSSKLISFPKYVLIFQNIYYPLEAS